MRSLDIIRWTAFSFFPGGDSWRERVRVYLFCASHTDSSMVREENNTVGTEVVHRQDDWMGFLFHFTVVVVCTHSWSSYDHYGRCCTHACTVWGRSAMNILGVALSSTQNTLKSCTHTHTHKEWRNEWMNKMINRFKDEDGLSAGQMGIVDHQTAEPSFPSTSFVL